MAKSFNESKSEIYDGHQVIFEFPVYDLAASEIGWITDKNYDTNCHFLPTSWRMQMEIQRVPTTGDVRIPVSLKRIDTINRPVDAFTTLRFSDANNRSFFNDVKCFGRRFVMPDDQMRENIIGYIRLADRQRLFNEALLVTVCIRIRCCHLDINTNSITSASAVKKKKLCSMM